MTPQAKFLWSAAILLFLIAFLALLGWLRRHDHQDEDDDSAEEKFAAMAERQFRRKFERTPPAGLRLVTEPPRRVKEKKG